VDFVVHASFSPSLISPDLRQNVFFVFRTAMAGFTLRIRHLHGFLPRLYSALSLGVIGAHGAHRHRQIAASTPWIPENCPKRTG
jgi:hypothetical protein